MTGSRSQGSVPEVRGRQFPPSPDKPAQQLGSDRGENVQQPAVMQPSDRTAGLAECLSLYPGCIDLWATPP